MDAQAKSGLLSIMTALAAAIAPAMAKALIERRRRSPSDKGELEMCRNHSHVTGRIFGMVETEEVIEVRMLVTQPLTVETSSGAKLTLPRYCVCSVRLDRPELSSGSQLREMAAQDEPLLRKEETKSTTGPITQPR